MTGTGCRLGLAGIVLGVAPVIAANRQITLPSFSHYSLPASLGVVLAAAGLISLLANRAVQTAAFSALIFISTLTHQGLGAAALREERTIAGFWQQMAWRAPSIASGTTLLVQYPGVDYGTDSDVVWGPASFIYYPEAQAELPVRVHVAALTADNNTVNSLTVRKDPLESTYRAHDEHRLRECHHRQSARMPVCSWIPLGTYSTADRADVRCSAGSPAWM
jgi:hypothetical protein